MVRRKREALSRERVRTTGVEDEEGAVDDEEDREDDQSAVMWLLDKMKNRREPVSRASSS